MTDDQKQHVVRPVMGMLTGMLPGLVLCLVLVGYFKGAAEAEAFLPMQDISVNGKVIAPTCSARFEEDYLRFAKTARGVGEPRDIEDRTRTLRLNLSQCDVDGIGVMFTAEFWPDFPARGRLRDKATQRPSEVWYYLLAPADKRGGDAAWPLLLSPDSPALETEKQHGNDNAQGDRRYFSLNKVNYWYDVKTPPKENEVLVIPFTVSVHHSVKRVNEPAQGELDATFTLQLSYR